MSSFKKFEDTKFNFITYDTKEFLENCLANDPMYLYEYIMSFINFVINNHDAAPIAETDVNKELQTLLEYRRHIDDGLNNIINVDKHCIYFILCRVPIILSMNSSSDKNELFKNNITYKSYSDIIDQFTPELVERFKEMIPLFDKIYEIIKDGSFMKLYQKEMTLKDFHLYLMGKLVLR